MDKTTLFSEKSFSHPGSALCYVTCAKLRVQLWLFKITDTDEAFEKKKYALLFSRCNGSGMELHQNR